MQRAAESDLGFNPEVNLLNVIRRAQYGLVNIREISQIANRDFGIRVERTEDNFPEDEWTWYHQEGEGNEPDTVYVLERDLRQKNGIYNLGSLFHEVIGGHRAYTYSAGIPQRFFDNRALWFLMETVEDPSVNLRTIRKYPMAKFLIRELYREDFDFLLDVGQEGEPLSAQVRESIAGFAMLPIHLQYCFNMVYRWYQSLDNPASIRNHPGVSDDRVIELTEKTWDAFKRATAVEVSPVDGSREAQKEALAQTQKSRIEIIEKEMEQDYLKLVGESKEEYKQRKGKKSGKKEGEQKQKEQNQGHKEDKEPNKEKEKSGGQEDKLGKKEGDDKEGESDAEIKKIEEELQKKMKPKLKPITKKEAEEAKRRKRQQEKGDQEKIEEAADFLSDFHPEVGPQQNEYVEREREERVAIYNAILELPETQQQIDGLMERADVVFRERKRGTVDKFRRPRDQRTGLEDGDLDEEIAHQAVWGDSHVFSVTDKTRERKEGMRNYCTTLLLDASGSMKWEMKASHIPVLNLPDGKVPKIPPKAFRALQGAIVSCEVSERLGVPFEVLALNAQNYVLIGFDQPFDDEAKASLVGYLDLLNKMEAGWNNDGFALDWATRRNFERQLISGERGLTIHILDGLPAPDADHSSPEYDLLHVIETVAEEGRSELIGLGLGLGTEHVEEFYKSKKNLGLRMGKYIPDISLFATVLGDILFERFF